MNYLPSAKFGALLIAVVGISLMATIELAKAVPAEGGQQTESTGRVSSGLDFEIYRARVEPIFLKTRENGVRCYDCHSILPTRLRLVRMTEGSSSWTEEQSRQNFAAVSQLVTPADPVKSRLLLHPLTPEEGGDPTHTGGKFWKSQADPEWRLIADWVSTGAPSGAPPSRAKTQALDFDFFKTKVEPIFLKARPGHARCYSCHSQPGRPLYLEPISPGETNWTEEQSRRNFQSVLQEVVPGDPSVSRLLNHPLAPEAGGDPFHSGGSQFQSQHDPDWLLMADWVRGPAPDAAPNAKSALIYVTNSAGDTIDVIDPAINRVVQVIQGIELPHGIAFSPDGKRVYISNESESVLDVVDRISGQILEKVQLSGHPNNLTITKDGARVLVGIRSESGVVDVIDTATLKRVKSIPVDGGVHNVYVTPDGKYAVSGSLESKAATVIDLQSEQAVWGIKFDHPVRPMAFETNPDGSTRRIFVQLSRLNGFAVVDFATHAEVARIKFPEKLTRFGIAEGREGTPSHGIGISPDGKTLWVNSTFANAVFAYSLPGLKSIGLVELPEGHPLGGGPSSSVPEWITFTPDSKLVYVSNSGAKSVTAIDTRTLKTVAVIPVGEVPKRMNTLVLH